MEKQLRYGESQRKVFRKKLFKACLKDFNSKFLQNTYFLDQWLLSKFVYDLYLSTTLNDGSLNFDFSQVFELR